MITNLPWYVVMYCATTVGVLVMMTVLFWSEVRQGRYDPHIWDLEEERVELEREKMRLELEEEEIRKMNEMNMNTARVMTPAQRIKMVRGGIYELVPKRDDD